MISFDGIRKRFGAIDVIRDVSFDLRPGAVTALVGPNASGKTTLIRIALGLVRPDAGVVRVGGTPIDPDGLYRRAIGYMPQAPRYADNLRVRDLLDLISALRPDEPHDETLMKQYEIDRVWDRRLGTLSGGTRQKINAAIAFWFSPAVLVLDEPTAGLDPLAARVLKEHIGRARAEGRTILVTSHVLPEVEELADDVMFLCEGTLRFAGPVRTLLAKTGRRRLEPAIADLMQGRVDPDAAAPSAAAAGKVLTFPGRHA